MQLQIAAHTIEAPDLHEAHAAELPVVFANAAVTALTDFHAAKVSIEADAHLSPVGKAAKLEPLAAAALAQVFHSLEAVEAERERINRNEAELLSTGAPETANQVQRDAEIRAWWAMLSAKERNRLLTEAEASPELGEFVRAVLRSPIPTPLDPAKQHLQELHNRIRRLENPEAAHAIAIGRDLIGWADHVLTHATAIARSATGKAPEQMARAAIQAGRERMAKKLFGVPLVEKVKAVLAAEQRRKAG
ncbi:hypothetical protein ACNQFN_14810 [Thauera butanivorans]|uniref:hypothetical protein n=1 Tax=Thauera butanivorans TaxID=86174 RepID=UPI003AB76CC2